MKLALSLLFTFMTMLLFAESLGPEASRIIFLARGGEYETALSLYQKLYATKKKHDFLLLQQVALAILHDGKQKSDPELQLLTLMGASVAAHEDVYDIIEMGLRSRVPQIQLVALSILATLDQDRADEMIFKMLGSNHLLIRYEALRHLCRKGNEQAFSHVESLSYKLDKDFQPIFPPLIAMIQTPAATRLLKRMLHDPSELVRLSAIMSIAECDREDLLPQVRQVAVGGHFVELEAAAFTLGEFKDETSMFQLQKLTRSPYSSVAIAACLALYKLGNKDAMNPVEQAAIKGDPFAVAALGDLKDTGWVLVPLLTNPNPKIHFAAIASLLKQKNRAVLPYLEEIFIHDQRDFAFIPKQSPGKTITTWEGVSGASCLFKEDPGVFEDDFKFRVEALEQLSQISQEAFIKMAARIFDTQENDLVPVTTDLLVEMETPEAIDCLRKYHQKLGAPLVRNYCALALYNLEEPGPYAVQLRQWVKTQAETELIRFEPFVVRPYGQNLHTTSPEESSKLLIDIMLAFAQRQDEEGISLLVEAIGNGHPNNRYVLAGLLLRATQ